MATIFDLVVGERCLLRIAPGNWSKGMTDEYLILEVSPSGKWIKLKNLAKTVLWKEIGQIELIEVLN